MKAKIVYIALALVLVFSLAAVVVRAGPVMAADVNPGDSIQDAIDAASPGDTINVAAGTYAGAVVNKSVTIIGEVGGGSVITSGPHYGGSHPGLTTAFKLDPGANEAEIRNFTVNCDDSAGYFFAIFSKAVDDAVIDSLTVNNAVQGITNWGGSGWEITNNTLVAIIASAGGGIAINLGAIPVTYPECSNNLVQYNTIASTAGEPAYSCPGIAMGLDMRGFTVADLPLGFIEITGNQILDNNYTGTGLLNEVGIEIGTILEEDTPGRDDILLATLNVTHDNTVAGNTIDGPDYGMLISNVTDLTVEGNEVKNCVNPVGGVDPHGVGIYLFDGISGVNINGNNIYNNANYGLLNDTGVTVDATNNWWGHASGPSGDNGRVNKAGKVIGKGDAVSANVDWDPWLRMLVWTNPAGKPLPPRR